MSIQAIESPTPARWREAVRGRRWSAHATGVAAVTALIAAIYAVFSLVLYATYRDSSYDLVIFDQAVRSYAHFHPGISIIKGVHNGFGRNFSLLGDHFSPILAALAPLYWIYNGPQTLLVAQAVLFALAIPWLWVFTRRALGGGWRATTAAYLVSVAYGLSWPLAAAAAFDFHEVAFAPVLTAIALERFQAGRLRSALIALGFLLLVKEDMGLLVAGIGLWLILSRTSTVRRQRLVGAGLVAAGLAYSVLATYVLIPAFGGRADYYWAYSAFGSDVPQVASYLLRHPLIALKTMVSPAAKLRTWKWLLAIFCFLPLLSPIVVMVLPLLAERMLNSRYPNWWIPHFQYNAYLIVPLTCAAADGAARLDRLARRAWVSLQVLMARKPEAREQATMLPAGAVALACCAAIFAATFVALPRFPLGEALHADFYRQTTRSLAAAAADARVPSGVQVEAANGLGPELSARDTVLMWDGEHPPLGSPWVVADVRRLEMTFTSVAAQRARVQLLLRSGYVIVFSRDGYLVLHRVRGAAPVPSPGGHS